MTNQPATSPTIFEQLATDAMVFAGRHLNIVVYVVVTLASLLAHVFIAIAVGIALAIFHTSTAPGKALEARMVTYREYLRVRHGLESLIPTELHRGLAFEVVENSASTLVLDFHISLPLSRSLMMSLEESLVTWTDAVSMQWEELPGGNNHFRGVVLRTIETSSSMEDLEGEW